MPYYHECPECGLNLDPCEICECRKEKAALSGETPKAAELTEANSKITTKIS